MYFGGNNIDTHSSNGITNRYAHEPKKTHLSRLIKIVAENQRILLSDKIQYGNEIHLNTTQIIIN